MSNMSYCRFENTYNDLRDCYNALGEEGIENLSESEQKFAKKLISLSEDIVEEFSEEFDLEPID